VALVLSVSVMPALRTIGRGFVALTLAMVVVPLFSGTADAAGKLSPPIIHERFTAVPCNHSTTIGLEGCAEGKLLATDHRLNVEVALIFKASVSLSQRRLFVMSEDLWLTYRNADCQSVAATYQGGSLAPVECADCEVTDNEARSVDLHGHFELLEQGNDSAPTWP
jgi:uncharacterized protein YecT (DUF1311 family)